MKPARFEHPISGDVQPGDLWRVAEVSLTGHVIFERVQAEPGQFRRRGDGLWPPLPDVRPVSDEEARQVAERMDAALDAGSKFVAEQAPFLPPDEVSAGLQRAIDAGWKAHDCSDHRGR